jgi:hypothetical protein
MRPERLQCLSRFGHELRWLLRPISENSTVGDEAIHVPNVSVCAVFEGEWAISCRDELLANAVPGSFRGRVFPAFGPQRVFSRTETHPWIIRKTRQMAGQRGSPGSTAAGKRTFRGGGFYSSVLNPICCRSSEARIRNTSGFSCPSLRDETVDSPMTRRMAYRLVNQLASATSVRERFHEFVPVRTPMASSVLSARMYPFTSN